MKRGEKLLIILCLVTIVVLGLVIVFSGASIVNKNNPEGKKDMPVKLSDAPTEAPKPSAPATSTPSPTVTNTPTPSPSPTVTNTPTPSPSPTLTPTPTPVIVEVVISAVGDVTLGVNQKQEYKGSFDEYYDLYGEEYFLEKVSSVFKEDTFTIVNLEGVLTNSDNIRTTKEWNMRGRPEYAKILSNASVEAVSLGNNHIMDYQWDGVNDTFQNVTENGMMYAISSPWGDQYGMYETPEGIQIGFVSVNEYYDGKNVYKWLEEGYNQLRAEGADLMLACMHWGGDKVYEPEPEQRKLGHWLVDLGYDLILGCHPHVIQGIECYNGAYIVHSMGNFCYGGSKNPSDKDSMIFQQTFTFVDGVLQEETKIRAIPCSLSSVTWRNDFRPRLLEGEDAAIWIKKLNSLSEEFGLSFDENGYLQTEAVEDVVTVQQ